MKPLLSCGTAVALAFVAHAGEMTSFHPTVEAALGQAHGLLTERYLSRDGLLYDYVGEIPTPLDCHEGRPNAIGWWSPIENGPMFTGPYLATMCEKVRRDGKEADRRLCRKMASGLMRAASVSDVPGMIVRGFATDGKSHYPLGSEDQTLPWFYGLSAYLRSDIPDKAERERVVSKIREVADALQGYDWKCPCDGRFKDEFRGNFKGEGLPFRGASHYLFILRATYEATGDRKWLERYEAACAEKHAGTDLTRVEICAKGYLTDIAKFSVERGGMWIYVCAQGCLRELSRMDDDSLRRAAFVKGLNANARRALKHTAPAAKYDNSVERPFRYANWRNGYRWMAQPTQGLAEKVASSGDRVVLGGRKDFERHKMSVPLACCAVAAFAGCEDDREAIARVIRHFDYSTLNISEFFLAEVAWYALPQEKR